MSATQAAALTPDSSRRDYLITPSRLATGRDQSPNGRRGSSGAGSNGPNVGVCLYGAFLVGKCGVNHETAGPKRRVLLVRSDGLMFVSGREYEELEQDLMDPITDERQNVTPPSTSEGALEVAKKFAMAKRSLWSECALRRHVPLGKLREVTYYPGVDGCPVVVRVFGEHDIYLSMDLRSGVVEDAVTAPSEETARAINPTYFADCVSWKVARSDENPQRYTFEVDQLRTDPSLQGPTGIVLDTSAAPPSPTTSCSAVGGHVFDAIKRALSFMDSAVQLDAPDGHTKSPSQKQTGNSAPHSGVTLGCVVSKAVSASTLQFQRSVLPDLSLQKSSALATYCTTAHSGVQDPSEQQQQRLSGRSGVVMRQKVLIRNIAKKASSPEAASTEGNLSANASSIYASHNNLKGSPMRRGSGAGLGSGPFAAPVSLYDWDQAASRLPTPLPMSRLPPFVDPTVFQQKHVVMMGVVLAAFIDTKQSSSSSPKNSGASNNQPANTMRCLLCFTSSKVYLIEYIITVKSSASSSPKNGPPASTSSPQAQVLLEAPLMRLQELLVEETNGVDRDGIPEQSSAVSLFFVEGGWRSSFSFSFPKTPASANNANNGTKKNVTSDVSAVSNVVRFLTRREGIDVPRLKFVNGTLIPGIRESTPQRPLDGGSQASLGGTGGATGGATTPSSSSFSGRPPMSPKASSSSLSRRASAAPVLLTEELVIASVPDFSPLKFFSPLDNVGSKHQEVDDGSGNKQYTLAQLNAIKRAREAQLANIIPAPTKRLLTPLMTKNTVLCRRILRLTSKGAWEPRILVIVFNSTTKRDSSLASMVAGEGTKIVICNEKRGIRRMVSILQIKAATISTYRSCKQSEDTDGGGRAAERASIQAQRERDGLPPIANNSPNRIPHETALILMVNKEHDLVIKLHGDYSNNNNAGGGALSPSSSRPNDGQPLLVSQAPAKDITIPQVVTVIKFLQSDLPIAKEIYYHDTATFVETDGGRKRITHGQLKDILSYKCCLEKPRDYEPVEVAVKASTPLNSPRSPRDGHDDPNGSFTSRRSSLFVRDPSQSFSPERCAHDAQLADRDEDSNTNSPLQTPRGSLHSSTVDGGGEVSPVPTIPNSGVQINVGGSAGVPVARTLEPASPSPKKAGPTEPIQQAEWKSNTPPPSTSTPVVPVQPDMGAGNGNTSRSLPDIQQQPNTAPVIAEKAPVVSITTSTDPTVSTPAPVPVSTPAASTQQSQPLAATDTPSLSNSGRFPSPDRPPTPRTMTSGTEALPPVTTRPTSGSVRPLPPAQRPPPVDKTPTVAAAPVTSTTRDGPTSQLQQSTPQTTPTLLPAAASSSTRPGSAPRGRHADPAAAAASSAASPVTVSDQHPSTLVPQYVSPHRHERLGRIDALLLEKQRLDDEFRARLEALQAQGGNTAVDDNDEPQALQLTDSKAALQQHPSTSATLPPPPVAASSTPYDDDLEVGGSTSTPSSGKGRPPLAPATPVRDRPTSHATSPPRNRDPSTPNVTRGFTAAAPSDTSRSITERHQAELDELRHTADTLKVLPFRVKVKGDVFMLFLRSIALPSIYRNIVNSANATSFSSTPKATLVCAELGYVCCLGLGELAKLISESVDHGLLVLPDESCRPMTDTIRIHRIGSELFGDKEGATATASGTSRSPSPFLFRYPTPTRGSEARLQAGRGGSGVQSPTPAQLTEVTFVGRKGVSEQEEGGKVIYKPTDCILCRSNESFAWELLPADTVGRVLTHNLTAMEGGGRGASSIMSLSSAVETVTSALQDQLSQQQERGLSTPNHVGSPPRVVDDDL